mmetsp:Transcript_25979/g.53152  ORF Transcript_25979/g.53152 Transcript_25979/m.53152 type:complete len:253 (-) Transcript_25979:2766-3524(-)
MKRKTSMKTRRKMTTRKGMMRKAPPASAWTSTRRRTGKRLREKTARLLMARNPPRMAGLSPRGLRGRASRSKMATARRSADAVAADERRRSQAKTGLTERAMALKMVLNTPPPRPPSPPRRPLRPSSTPRFPSRPPASFRCARTTRPGPWAPWPDRRGTLTSSARTDPLRGARVTGEAKRRSAEAARQAAAPPMAVLASPALTRWRARGLPGSSTAPSAPASSAVTPTPSVKYSAIDATTSSRSTPRSSRRS